MYANSMYANSIKAIQLIQNKLLRYFSDLGKSIHCTQKSSTHPQKKLGQADPLIEEEVQNQKRQKNRSLKKNIILKGRFAHILFTFMQLINHFRRLSFIKVIQQLKINKLFIHSFIHAG